MKENIEDFHDIPENYNLENYIDSILFKNFLIKNIEDKKELKLTREIKRKKYQISHMFNMKFGKHFLNQKPESLKIFEKRLAKYLFDPDSKFLSKFPKLQRQLRHEKKISEELLKAKIDMGSLVFYDLTGKDMRVKRNINNRKEKLLEISKNFAHTPIKDIVANTFYKKKFWDKNSKRLKQFFKNIAKSNNYLEERDENNLAFENEDNNSIKDIINKDCKTHREKGNLKLSPENTPSPNNNLNQNSKNSFSNKTNENFNTKKNNILNNHNMGLGSNKSEYIMNIENIERSSVDLKNNESNSFGKKESLRKRSSINNNSVENIVENDKLISSYNEDFKKFYDLIPKISNYNNLSRNKNSNNSNLITKSNTNNNTITNKNNNIYNITNIKANTRNFSLTINNFNKKNIINKSRLKIFNTFKNNSSNKYSPRFYIKKNEDALKRKKMKFKNNFNNQIFKLNRYTNKCNTELIKLIDGNNDNNFKERKNNILKNQKIDMKEILVEHKKTKTSREIEKKIKEVEKEKDTVKNLIKVAINDTGDNFDVDPKKMEKRLKKNINHITDEEALEMLEDIMEKEKLLDFREIIADKKKLEKKREHNMKLLRLKAENNYEKMLKLKNMIQIDKGKIFK